MVVIINGEIVQDSDPRAKQLRGESSSRSSSTPSSGQRKGRIASFADLNSQNQQQQQRGRQQNFQGSHDEDVDGLLTPISRILGIAGKRLTIPAIQQIGFTGYSFPLIHIFASILFSLLVGNWRFAIVFFLALSIINPK